MRFILFALFASPILALTITSPTDYSTINPSQDFTITWTSSSSDPSTLSFVVHETNSAVLAEDQTVANGVATSAGTFTVPANTLQEFGTGFVVQALNGGNVIAQSGVFVLAAGANNVQTLSNGQETYVSATTAASVDATLTSAAGTGVVTATTTSSSGVLGFITDGTATSTSTGLVFVTGETATSTSGVFGFLTDSATGSVTTTTKRTATPNSSTSSSTSTSSGLAGNVHVGVTGLLGGLMGALALLA